MIETTVISGEDAEKLLKITCDMVCAIREVFEREHLRHHEIYCILKYLTINILDDYENEMELAEMLFKEVRKGLTQLQDFQSKTTSTLQ